MRATCIEDSVLSVGRGWVQEQKLRAGHKAGVIVLPLTTVSYYCVPKVYLQLQCVVNKRCYTRIIYCRAFKTNREILRAAKQFAKGAVRTSKVGH